SMQCAPFLLTMQILFASVSYHACSCGFEDYYFKFDVFSPTAYGQKEVRQAAKEPLVEGRRTFGSRQKNFW
ncbi:MAG: hypothetical protein ACI363_02650, partial [Phocaeicola plebeius]